MTLLLQSPSFELCWESQKGVYRLQSPGRSLEGIAGVEVLQLGSSRVLETDQLTPGRVTQRKVEDDHGLAEELFANYQETQGLTISLKARLYPTRPFVLFQISLTNVGPETIKVRRFFLRSNPGGFQSIESPTGFYSNGWQSWSRTGFLPVDKRDYTLPLHLKGLQGPMMQNSKTPWPSKAGRFWSETVGAVVTPREALIAGGASLADQFVQVRADLRPGHRELLLQSQVDDVPLATGEARTSEWFYLEWVPLPNPDPLAQYAYAVMRQMQTKPLQKAPTGWSSWYIYWNKVAEEDMMENLASAALLADELPLQVIQLDEGFQRVWGDWEVRNERFPHDLKWLVDRIRGSEFRPGLWLGPLTAHPKSSIATTHPDWLLRNHHGRPVSAGYISHFMSWALDPTHPGVEAHLRDLIGTAVNKWGYDYLKLDFMYAGALSAKRHNPRLTRAQALRQAFRVIREAAGPDVYLVGCGAPLGPAVGLVDAMRVGADTAPDWLPSFRGINFKQNPSMPSLRNSLQNVVSRAWIHNRWWTNDPDTLMVRESQTQLSPDEVLSQVTLLGLSGGLFMVSDNLEALSPERRAMAAVLLPPLLDGMDVLDLFERKMPEEVLVPVARPCGRWKLIGLFNWQNHAVERSLPTTVNLNPQKDYHIVDFWERRYFHLLKNAESPVVHIPPHGCVLLGVRSVKPTPQLVATTFHISQGAEITTWQVALNSLTMTLTLDRLASGEVWLALPARPNAVFFNETALPETAVRTVSRGIWSVSCRLNRVGDLRVEWPEPEVAF